MISDNQVEGHSANGTILIKGFKTRLNVTGIWILLKHKMCPKTHSENVLAKTESRLSLRVLDSL